MTEIYVDFC